MPQIGRLNVNTIAAVLAIILSLGSVLIAYGRSDGSDDISLSQLQSDVTEIKQELKAKRAVDTDVLVKLGVVISRLDDVSKRLDHFENIRPVTQK
jgi:hypothetical protein